jgi:hypothetical protein
LSAKLLKNGTLKTPQGLPHGMPTTEAATINADLLAFIKDETKFTRDESDPVRRHRNGWAGRASRMPA